MNSPLDAQSEVDDKDKAGPIIVNATQLTQIVDCFKIDPLKQPNHLKGNKPCNKVEVMMDNRCTRNHKIYNPSLINRNRIILNSNQQPHKHESKKKYVKFTACENSKKIIEKKTKVAENLEGSPRPTSSKKKNTLLAQPFQNVRASGQCRTIMKELYPEIGNDGKLTSVYQS